MTTIDLTITESDTIPLETLTWDEIKARYPNEKVLLAYPVYDAQNQPESGLLLCHSANREEFYRLAMPFQGQFPLLAIEYTGEYFQEGMITLL